MNTYGTTLTLSLFGESHGGGIGAVISGLPAGFPLDMDELARQMARRAPGNSLLATARREPDEVELLSGIFEGKTTGAPLCGMIRNTNTRSKDYTPNLPRPGHADLAAFLKYGGHADYRGGGHFSGRITAPLVFAGAVCRQILAAKGVTIGAHIAAIKTVEDTRFTSPTADCLNGLTQAPFPVLNPQIQTAMEEEILSARSEGNSVGGIIECCAVGLPAGLGGPYFDSMEGKIAAMMYAIPAIKGVEFGSGFAMTTMTGMEANDPIQVQDGQYRTTTNHNGGINGGITNSMPIILRVAVKPTPSIFQRQDTVDLNTGENSTLELKGRHDPCVVPRAVPVVESGLAICLLDAMLTGNPSNG